MTDNYNYLFQYLEKEGIFIDKNEFLFQIQSHPDYPSLLSIADTLSFFGVKNGIIRVPFSDLEDLPNQFVTLLKEDKGNPELCFIEKKEEVYFYTKDNKSSKISQSSLEQQWNGIVLLVEPSKEEIVLILIPKSLKTQLYKGIRDSFASEHGARMTAMHTRAKRTGEAKQQTTQPK